jgi:hypothetical protein
MAIFNVAGGIRYHWRGWRSAGGRWRPFRAAVSDWLAGWLPGGDRLLIVGASGGYCLDMRWVGRFAEVVCLDPDPVARWVFARRLRRASPGTRLAWRQDDFLDEHDPAAQLARLQAFMGEYPGAPVLFSNFLGQLGLLMDERAIPSSLALAHWRERLVRDVLEGRPWASFHDRISGELSPRLELPLRAPARLDDAEIIRRFYGDPGPDRGHLIELADHGTEGLFPADREHTYFSWELTPGCSHLIEGTHSG